LLKSYQTIKHIDRNYKPIDNEQPIE